MSEIVCLIATWRDGELLAKAVASAAPHVDAVIVLDGGYEGVVDAGHAHSRNWELEDADAAGADVWFDLSGSRGRNPRTGLWPDEITKRNALLELGRQNLPNAPAGDRWALVLDADELLVNGEGLREAITWANWLEAFMIGLPRVEPDGRAWHAPSRLFRLTDGVRYAGRSYWLEVPELDGHIDLEHAEMGPWPAGSNAVYVEHRWDRRPAWRQVVQQRYGRLLAERDHGTDG